MRNLGRTLRNGFVGAALTVGVGSAVGATITLDYYYTAPDPDVYYARVTFEDIAPNQLKITFDNKAPDSTVITGLTFNITEQIDNATVTSFLDGNGAAITGWNLTFDSDSNISPGNTVFELLFDTTNGSNQGIYNNGTATVTSNVVPDIATLILTITDPSYTGTDPFNLVSIDGDWLRLQRVGPNQQGSLKLTTSSGTPSTSSGPSSSGPLPEPGTLTLFGVGILAALFSARRRRQALT